MLNPIDLELPERFKAWRPRQFETAIQVLRSDTYGFFLDSPTGTGKSLIAAAVQRMLDTNAVYCATTKQLQDQLLYDFPYAKTLKGRNAYKCLLFPSSFPTVSAEHCTNTKQRPCKFIGRCPYKIAKAEALAAPLAVLNTAYFLSEANFVGGFSDTKFLILDEFDTVEDQLMGFISLVITQKQLLRLQVPEPKYKTKFESWVEWARPAIKHISAELDKLETDLDEIDSWGTVELWQLRREAELKRLISKLRFFVKEVDENWVWYPGEDKWMFKPVWIAKYASANLWDHAFRVLGMSATILDPAQVARNTGIEFTKLRKYTYERLPSPFPKEHRPVIYEPCANLTNKTMATELPKLAVAVGKLMDKHRDEKILIHSVSYKVMDYIKKYVQSKRIITHGTINRAEILDKFKRSPDPLVLLSPSMDRGVDLPEEECRVVIIAKMPYPDLGDQQVRKRVYASKDGNNWYAHKTISTIVQMAGRGVRSADDYAITYILDAQFERLLDRNRGMFPGWFLEAIIT